MELSWRETMSSFTLMFIHTCDLLTSVSPSFLLVILYTSSFFIFYELNKRIFFQLLWKNGKSYLLKTHVIKCFIFLFIQKTVMNKNVCWPGIFFLYLHLNWWLKFCVGQDILRFFSIHHQQIPQNFNIFLSLWKNFILLSSSAT